MVRVVMERGREGLGSEADQAKQRRAVWCCNDLEESDDGDIGLMG